MKHAQIEIVGLLVIVLILVVAGIGYLSVTLTADDTQELTPTQRRYQQTFVTALTQSTACQGSPDTLAGLGAAGLVSTTHPCSTTPGQEFTDTVDTILNNTLDYRYGNTTYELIVDDARDRANYTFGECPPLSEAPLQQASTQTVPTSYATLHIRLTLCPN